VFDLLVFVGLASVLEPLGAGLGLLYVLVADAAWPGQSPGKRLARVVVHRTNGARGHALLASALRNLPLAVALLLALIPVVSWLLFPTLGLFLVGLEALLTRHGRLGRRLGDVLADSYVADLSPPATPAPKPSPPGAAGAGTDTAAPTTGR
jgi:uncharacterized RDD family membrane protein YckC